MNATEKEPMEMKSQDPYPLGRWTPPPKATPASLFRPLVPYSTEDLEQASLKELFWNVADSPLVREASRRLEQLLDTASMAIEPLPDTINTGLPNPDAAAQ